MALLMWQPWMDVLPGCCFVEESCEALLSRMASQCRAHTTMRGFNNTQRLYQSLPLPSGEARRTSGMVRSSLVQTLRLRLRALISQPTDRPFPQLTSSSSGSWVKGFPVDWTAPPSLRGAMDVTNWVRCLQGAFALLTAPKEPTSEVRQWLDDNVPRRDGPVHTGVQQVWSLRDSWLKARGYRVRSQTGSRLGATQGAADRSNPAADQPPLAEYRDHGTQVPPSQSSQQSGSSIYQPPEAQDTVSQGFVSSAATDGLGELGELQVSEADMLLIQDMGECETE